MRVLPDFRHTYCYNIEGLTTRASLTPQRGGPGRPQWGTSGQAMQVPVDIHNICSYSIKRLITCPSLTTQCGSPGRPRGYGCMLRSYCK
jgi:hypothetical protein